MEYTYMVFICGILLDHKKEGKFCQNGNMTGPGEHYVEWNESDRERQIL